MATNKGKPAGRIKQARMAQKRAKNLGHGPVSQAKAAGRKLIG